MAIITDNRRVWWLSTKFFTANIILGIYLGFIWDLYVLGLKSKVFFVKNNNQIFKTLDKRLTVRRCSLAENTQNAPTFFGPICLPVWDFWKKSSRWVSVRDLGLEMNYYLVSIYHPGSNSYYQLTWKKNITFKLGFSLVTVLKTLVCCAPCYVT